MDKKEVLKQYFGYDSFRQGQEKLIDAVLGGRDALGVMPTGAGKSLCYQVPALMMPGITLVISPLISLMKDQVGALNQAGVHAAYINSSLTMGQYVKAMKLAEEGRYKIIYVAPERLGTESFLSFARKANISMIAVDEAHCVSQWGQDFRPSYLKIAEFMEVLPHRPVVAAFTATATKKVREDILSILELVDPETVVTGYDRQNLFFEVRAEKNKYAFVLNFIRNHPGESGIIYCLSRKGVEEVCADLLADGIPATRYHAGLSPEERAKNQEDFLYDERPIITATNAFGMGIDKSNVRFVIHYNMPKDIESYYQEAGRAGRDGSESQCILLYSPQDVRTNQFLISQEQAEGLSSPEQAEVRARSEERLKQMTFYSTTHDCLRGFILRYFGEVSGGYCGKCSNCMTEFVESDVTAEARILMNCVLESGQRFGMSLIADLARGSTAPKIREKQLDSCKSFGALAHVPIYRIRYLLSELLQGGYLELAGDKYPIVRFTEKSQSVFESRILIKEKKEEKRKPKKISSGIKKGNNNGISNGISEGISDDISEDADQFRFDLFDALRKKRMEIAREKHLPPYIVFTDKTLKDMAVKMPQDESEMLDVSGVGKEKYRKYGEEFLAVLDKYRG